MNIWKLIKMLSWCVVKCWTCTCEVNERPFSLETFTFHAGSKKELRSLSQQTQAQVQLGKGKTSTLATFQKSCLCDLNVIHDTFSCLYVTVLLLCYRH